jgi:hypothetical protein
MMLFSMKCTFIWFLSFLLIRIVCICLANSRASCICIHHTVIYYPLFCGLSGPATWQPFASWNSVSFTFAVVLFTLKLNQVSIQSFLFRWLFFWTPKLYSSQMCLWICTKWHPFVLPNLRVSSFAKEFTVIITVCHVMLGLSSVNLALCRSSAFLST